MARAVANPYLFEYRKLLKSSSGDSCSPFGMLLGQLGLIVNTTLLTRTDLTRKYSFAIPDQKALSFIASWGPIIEMGAGTGYWTFLLRIMKVDVIAYENFSGYGPDGYGFENRWTPITKGNAASVKAHPERTLFLCWPDYKSMFASNCLRYYRGNRLVYIGEGRGGCTANDHFHDLLRKEWTLVKTIMLPTWPGIHDNLYAYERTEKLRVPRKLRGQGSQSALRKLRAPHLAAPVRRKRRSTRKKRTGQVPGKGLPVRRVPETRTRRKDSK